MNEKTTNIVAYFGLIGFLLAWFVGDKENCKFHINQGLLLTIISIASSIVITILSTIVSAIPLIGTILAILVSLLYFVIYIAILVFFIMGIISAVKEEEKELPLIGGIKILK